MALLDDLLVALPSVRSARHLAELYFGARLNVIYAEKQFTAINGTTKLLSTDRSRIIFEVACSVVSQNVYIGHDRSAVNAAVAQVISGDQIYREDWRSHLDAVSLELWVNPTGNSNFLVRVWTLAE